MNNRAMAGLAVALMLGSMGVGAAEMAAADASKEKPAAIEAAVVSVTATVKDIDYKTRVVTLQKKDGSTVSMEVGPEAVRFNEVKKGDVVQVDYRRWRGLGTWGTP